MVVTSELQLQAAIFQHHWNTRPEERGLLFHVNNKARNAIEGNKMKAMGVVSGVSDFIYLKPGGSPLLLELKFEAGIQSKEQRNWQLKAQTAGYDYRIIRTLQDFINLM